MHPSLFTSARGHRAGPRSTVRTAVCRARANQRRAKYILELQQIIMTVPPYSSDGVCVGVASGNCSHGNSVGEVI